MATKDDVKPEHEAEALPEQSADPSRPNASSEALATTGPIEGGPNEEREVQGGAPVGAESPTQLGPRRFVYAAYFAGAIAIAFLASKIIGFAWAKLQSWKPRVGEPLDELVMPVSALVGALVAVYFWYRTRARQLAEEVATEMSKVTWPTRTEVTNGTFVVIVTTVLSTIFFALMDKFWGFVTNLVYGST